jgi:hypothetical protein
LRLAATVILRVLSRKRQPHAKLKWKAKTVRAKSMLKHCGTSHMSGFQVKSVFLEMPEKTLNPPTLAVDLECFFSAEAVADNHERSVPATSSRRF